MGNSVNTLVPAAQLVPAALGIAKEITSNSPDAVQSTKHGLLLSQKLNHSESLMTHIWSNFSKRVYKGDNIKEGLKAFAERRAPVWKNPAKL
ncbi:hypothetical protein D9756_006212 [Leucocoprinus leucothites]|uniref:Enoyl-CoA hydratase n=1 Tax=Leucocoprinus leucothites TaxID=201217 RepID=A0A8H5FXN8_9AGAR|nr:hypothetical protein D9756_006212 [Leucoagaricus leucothites]